MQFAVLLEHNLMLIWSPLACIVRGLVCLDPERHVVQPKVLQSAIGTSSVRSLRGVLAELDYTLYTVILHVFL